MSTTKLFKNGNSQAVRIPAELAYERADMALETEPIADEIRTPPKPRTLEQLLDKFGAFSDDFMPQGRTDEEETERPTL
jgi:antitoxin VapB